MNKNKFYITTAIPYVNFSPHLGFALEIIQTDVIARYHRLLAEDVYFLTGTDENALKNVQAAEKEKITPKQLVDKYSAQFKALKISLNLSFDNFIRTTEKKHFLGSQKLWLACQKDIYKKAYKGKYCIGCEEFKTEKDLIDNKCPEHPNKNLELIEEENYFFKLSKYQTQLENLIETDKLKIIPQERKNEVLSFVKSGLKDFSISRSKKRAKGWGIPVPNDPEQFIYVWFDALINYITGLDYADNGDLFQKYWVTNQTILHCIGKGIIRFHAVYWPAMLISAGINLPTQEFVHGYVTVNGQKISKSLGNVIDPVSLVKQYGTDALRYYLLKEIPSTKDGDFNIEHFKEVYNADLANGLGNLVQRTLTLVQKFFNSRVPNIKEKVANLPLQKNYEIQIWKKYGQYIQEYKFNEAVVSIWELVKAADQYIDKHKPWELAKNGQTEKLATVLYDVLKSLHQIAWMIYPFLPQTAQEIGKRLGIEFLTNKNPLVKYSWQPLKSGNKIVLGKPLFPRIK